MTQKLPLILRLWFCVAFVVFCLGVAALAVWLKQYYLLPIPALVIASNVIIIRQRLRERAK